MRSTPSTSRVRSFAVIAVVGALLAAGCGVASETTAATVYGEAITDSQVERAARVQVIGNVVLGEDEEVPMAVRRRALSYLVAARLLQTEQARLNLDDPEGLADQVASQLQTDPAFKSLSEGEQNDLVSSAVVLSGPPPAPDGSQALAVIQQVQQALISDPAARKKFRQAHPQMFREVCFDVAEAQPDEAEALNNAIAEDPDAAFEEFGALGQCQTAAAGDGMVPGTSPQWSSFNALFSGTVDELVGPFSVTVPNPDPAAFEGGDSLEITRWIRPHGSRPLDDAGAAEFVSMLDANGLLSLLALQPNDVEIDPRYGDLLTAGPPDSLQVVRVQPNGSGVATPPPPAGDPAQ